VLTGQEESISSDLSTERASVDILRDIPNLHQGYSTFRFEI
jgi:hypothetical protein